jgi:hypothetical protein
MHSARRAFIAGVAFSAGTLVNDLFERTAHEVGEFGAKRRHGITPFEIAQSRTLSPQLSNGNYRPNIAARWPED